MLGYLLCHGVMGEEEPETKDGLGKNVEDGVSNNLGVNTNVAGSISDAPDAAIY